MKQKKSTKVAPTITEINSSNVCQQLQVSFNIFQDSKSNPDSIEFTQFIRDFEVFLKEETNPKLLNYFSPLYIQDITVHICSITFDASIIRQTFHLLNLIVSKTGVTFSALSYMTLFLFLTNGDEERFDILKNERISIDIFSDESFFDDFINGPFFNMTFQKLFLIVASKEICQFYTNLIFKVSPINMLSNYDMKQILDNFNDQWPKKAVFIEVAVFLSGILSVNEKFKFFFNEKKNFDFLSELLNEAPFDSIIECFTYLIFTEPPNFLLLVNVIDFYKKNLRIQNQFFDGGFKLIQSHPEIAVEVNSVVPLSEWITDRTSIEKMRFVMELLIGIDASLVSQFLPFYFVLLTGKTVDFFVFGIEIVECLILHHQVTLAFLFNLLFLEIFVLQPSTDMLCEMFTKVETFSQLVFDIYELPSAEPYRKEILDKIIQVVMQKSELAPIVSIFLSISGTPENLRGVMNLIESSKNGNICETLSLAFLKSDTFIHNFLREYGLKWIDSIFNQEIIDIQMVKKLIISMTQRLAILNIDEFIECLPKDHPLFSLDEKDIRSLVYGYESPYHFYPIKVYSLFHMIPGPEQVDPYNAAVIGRNKVLKKFENFMDLPIINDVGNRYVTDDFFYRFLKTPTQLERFADPSYDHFPLFQVFEYMHEKVFDMKFKSLSFWFRFSKKVDDSLKIPFFHAGKFNLFVKQSNLLANYEGTQYELPINPLNWNHIFISIYPKIISHKLKIYVNLNKAVFTSPAELGKLDDFGFLIYASYLFVGPAIRVYESKTHDMGKIFELGPSSMMKLNEDHLILPSSDFLADRNMLPVPYYGFPAHFKSEEQLNYFFEVLKETRDENEFDQILSLYFKVYLILKNSKSKNNELFASLLSFFGSNPGRLTKERFSKVLDFFGKNRNKIVLLNEILQNKLLWKNVSNDLIIFSLISYFKSFDFYEDIDKFQYFLASRIILNQKSKFMMISFLINSKALPKCQQCLLKLYQAHHYMCRRQNKEIQCEITNTIAIDKEKQNDVVIDEKDQYLFILNQRNISTQCEFDNDDENNVISSYFDEQFSLFNEIKNTGLQFNITDCFCEFLKKPENIENMKTSIPMDDLISLFIVSENSFKASLFRVFILIEKHSPGTLMVNNLFLTAFFPLFIYQDVWDEVMSLITTEDGKLVKNTPLISLLLALIWSLTVVSMHSIAQTGRPFKLSFDKEVKFCLENAKDIAMNKNSLHFIHLWYPLLLGFVDNKSDNPISMIKIENIEISPPKVSDLSHHIWKTVIQAARKVDDNLPLKKGQFHFREFKSFIPISDLLIFLINVILSSSKDHFIHLFAPILCIPMISEKEISETFVCQFITSCLSVLSQTFQLETLFVPFFPILHYMSSSGLLKFNFQFILSSFFVIVARLRDLYSKSFKKALPSINNLMISIFSNCDNETLPVLFKILQQDVQIFSEIIQATNSIDIYLYFFQKVAQNCYTNFDSFFKKFLTVSKIDQKNKMVEDLVNHVESQDVAAMNKWNKALNSLSSVIKTVKNETNNCFSSMMAELQTNSKELSKIYFVSQKRQKEFAQSLKQVFESSENVQNLQENFNDSIKKLYESAIKKKSPVISRKLLPFSLPLSLPRLLVPAPIQTPKSAIEFITENGLYSKEAKNANSRINFIHQSQSFADDSERNPKSALKKRERRLSQIRPVGSQPLPRLADSENAEPKETKEKQIKLQQSLFSSSSPQLADFILNPIVLKCKLKRLNYSIQSSVLVTSHHIELTPFYPSGNFPLHPKFVAYFVMEVVNGFWGVVSVVEGRIVIKIPVSSILGISQTSPKSVTFWTMKSGTFTLEGIDSEIFTKKPFNRLCLFTSHDAVSNKKEVIQKWSEGFLSNSQMIVLLNICEGKTYVDKNSFVEFPDSLSVFGTFSPINESLHSSLVEGIVKGSENYSNLIELKENVNTIVEFIKKFGVSCSIEKINCPSPHFTMDSQFFCQKFSGTVPSFSLFDENSILTDLPPLSARVSATHSLYITVDRSESTVNLHDAKSGKKSCLLFSEDFSFARSICVSKSCLFLVIDIENGTSRVYRILKDAGVPSKIELVRRCSFLHDQITTVNDSELLAATFSGKEVYLWPLYRFSYHRVIEFERKIRFCQFDDSCGTFWACDKFSAFLFDLNGKLFSKYKFERKITSFAVVPQRVRECSRCAAVGFADGSLSLISPKIESAELFVKDLKKCHESKIVRITFNPQSTYFLTVDDCQNGFFWTTKSAAKSAKEIDVRLLEGCPLCGGKPSVFCASCKRAFCAKCMKNSRICTECSQSEA